MLDYLIIIQARLGSTRLPNKVMQTVGGIPMVKRVWMAAKETGYKTVVAWPERYPDLDENNVLERFRRISLEFPSKYIVRLTADCPLIRTVDIEDMIHRSRLLGGVYTSNHCDGYDVQIFKRNYLFDTCVTHKEHVISDFSTKSTGLSVNTQEDLERVRRLANAE